MSARFISLHYRGGTSDKMYHMQIIPSGTAPGTWDLWAQNGRRGGTLTNRHKGKSLSSFEVNTLFNEILIGKKRNPGYWEVPLEGPSLAAAAKNLADTKGALSLSATMLPIPTPTWEGWADEYIHACSFLSLPADTRQPVPGIVIFGDLAHNLQEGLIEAAELCVKGACAVLSSNALSTECRSWIHTLPAAQSPAAFAYIAGQSKGILKDLS